MDEILHRLKNPRVMIPLQIPTNNGFNHGFKVVRNGFRPSTVGPQYQQPPHSKGPVSALARRPPGPPRAPLRPGPMKSHGAHHHGRVAKDEDGLPELLLSWTARAMRRGAIRCWPLKTLRAYPWLILGPLIGPLRPQGLILGISWAYPWLVLGASPGIAPLSSPSQGCMILSFRRQIDSMLGGTAEPKRCQPHTKWQVKHSMRMAILASSSA